MIDYILLSIISYIGLFCGLSLGFIAPEEIKPLNKYLLWLSWCVTIGIFVALLFTVNHFIIMLGIIAFFGWLLIFKQKPISIQELVISIPFFIAVSANSAIVAIALFLCGFPLGTLFLTTHVKKEKIVGSKAKLFKKLLLETNIFWLNIIVIGVVIFFLS